MRFSVADLYDEFPPEGPFDTYEAAESTARQRVEASPNWRFAIYVENDIMLAVVSHTIDGNVVVDLTVPGCAYA